MIESSHSVAPLRWQLPAMPLQLWPEEGSDRSGGGVFPGSFGCPNARTSADQSSCPAASDSGDATCDAGTLLVRAMMLVVVWFAPPAERCLVCLACTRKRSVSFSLLALQGANSLRVQR